MKKCIALLLAALLCFAFVSCKGNELPSSTPDPEQDVPETAQEQAAITEKNYKQLFSAAPEYAYIAHAYYKAPEGMFAAADSFVDAYVPYSAAVSYPNDGHAIETEAHGMRVFHTIVKADGNAQDVVEAAYKDMLQDSTIESREANGDTTYSAEFDIAIKSVTVTEQGKEAPRVTLLYADSRGNGYYVFAKITYLPEQYDDAHDGLLEELRDVFACNLPAIPAY